MKQDIKTCVIPFSKLEKVAYEYCKVENHISDEIPEKRREKFQKQAAKVWDGIKHAEVQVELVFVEQGTEGASLFPKEWLEKHIEIEKKPFRVCLYCLSILQEFSVEEKISLQFLQDTWCSSVLLAAKDKVEQYLMMDRWRTKKVKSVAPGIEDLPLECVGLWAKVCMQVGIGVTVEPDGHMTPENSLFAAFIEIE